MKGSISRTARRLRDAVVVVSVLCGPSAVQVRAQGAPERVFASDAGLVLNFIKADKSADFEMVVEKLHEVLQQSAKPERRKQAESWKVFKSPDPVTGGSVLYVFVIDPAVTGADYTVSTALAEALTQTELTEIYAKYAGAYAAGQNIVNLTLVADFARPPSPAAAASRVQSDARQERPAGRVPANGTAPR
jgi:hypothetical protein